MMGAEGRYFARKPAVRPVRDMTTMRLAPTSNDACTAAAASVSWSERRSGTSGAAVLPLPLPPNAEDNRSARLPLLLDVGDGSAALVAADEESANAAAPLPLLRRRASDNSSERAMKNDQCPNALSATPQILLIIAVASRGYMPFAVSPDSITASQPSARRERAAMHNKRITAELAQHYCIAHVCEAHESSNEYIVRNLLVEREQHRTHLRGARAVTLRKKAIVTREHNGRLTAIHIYMIRMRDCSVVVSLSTKIMASTCSIITALMLSGLADYRCITKYTTITLLSGLTDYRWINMRTIIPLLLSGLTVNRWIIMCTIIPLLSSLTVNRCCDVSALGASRALRVRHRLEHLRINEGSEAYDCAFSMDAIILSSSALALHIHIRECSRTALLPPHLRRTNHGLACDIGPRHHALLREKHSLGWQLHAQITPRNHYSVRRVEYRVVVGQPCLVLDFRNNAQSGPRDAADRIHLHDVYIASGTAMAI